MEGLGAGFRTGDACVAVTMRQCAAERALRKVHPSGPQATELHSRTDQ